jgi:hypothetical protein
VSYQVRWFAACKILEGIICGVGKDLVALALCLIPKLTFNQAPGALIGALLNL